MSKIICFLLFFALTIPLSAQSKSKDVLLFEISRAYQSGPKSSSTTFYFYQSGRIDCQTESRRLAYKTIRGKKSKCRQTSPAKISELVKIAEETDFQTANEKYKFFSGGIDWGPSLYITYFSRKTEKNIRLGFAKFGLEQVEPIPALLKKFLAKIGEIDEKLKVADELIIERSKSCRSFEN